MEGWMPSPTCFACGKSPAQILEYVGASDPENYGYRISPDDYVRREEGTYNPQTNRFACTSCYIDAGEPTTATGWKAP